jgi:phospholipid/cholesterol/gamma-HCH transport system ATP-binding protein
MEQKEAMVIEQQEIGPEKNALELKNIKKSFNGKTVLADISFKLNKGENLVVLGKSGSGKSVLIKCIVRLIETDSGEILVFGKNVSSLKAEELNITRKKIGFLFQSGALYDSMSVRENLEFPLRDKKELSENDITVMVEESLSDVGLSEVIDKMPSELSGGMRKRLGLARTMILRPDIMLYDEPTTGLDPITSKEISKLILEVQKKSHTSSIIITHDVECAKITANRIIVIKEGLIAAEGTFSELSKSEDKWIRSFFE